jgi:hypothetical protein
MHPHCYATNGLSVYVCALTCSCARGRFLQSSLNEAMSHGETSPPDSFAASRSGIGFEALSSLEGCCPQVSAVRYGVLV